MNRFHFFKSHTYQMTRCLSVNGIMFFRIKYKAIIKQKNFSKSIENTFSRKFIFKVFEIQLQQTRTILFLKKI